MNINLIIFSHSDYSYLWPIIEEKIISLMDLNPIFISNNTELDKPKGFINYLEYDSNKCYSERWQNILPKIESKYIFLVHDVNIIINYDSEKIKELLILINDNNIDRCSLNVFKNNDSIKGKTIELCDLNSPKTISKTFIPFDLSTSIWNKESFLNLWLNFPLETYQNSELNEKLQIFCRKNFKIYGLNKDNNNKIYYSLGRPYYNLFKILHITIKGNLPFPPEAHMDLKEDFLRIIEKYNLKNKIRINNEYKFILDYNKSRA